MRESFIRIGLLVGLLLAPCLGMAEEEPPVNQTIIIATGSVGGTFLPVGQDLAKWLERRCANLSVYVDTTYGSVDNVRRLSHGAADLAIVGLSPLRKMLDQTRFEVETFCILGTLYIDAEQFIIDKELVRMGSVMDLNGVHMYPGPHKSGGEVDTRLLLSALDVEPQYVYPLERTKGYSEAAQALAWNEFHAATFSGGVPIQAVTDLFVAYPDRFVILPFSRFQMSRVRHRNIDFVPVEIPAGAYPGLDEPIMSVGSPNVLLAGPSVDEAMIKRLKQVMQEGIQEPGMGLRNPTVHPVLQRLTPELWTNPTLTLRCGRPDEKAGLETGGGESAGVKD